MAWLEIHVTFMVIPHGFLRNCTIDTGGFNTLVAKKFLYLFDRHTGGQKVSRACPAETVRVDVLHASRATDAVDDIFQPASCKAVMGSLTADKKGGIIVCTGFQIVFQVYVGAGVEICHALLIPFAEDGDIVFGKRKILPVKA